MIYYDTTIAAGSHQIPMRKARRARIRRAVEQHRGYLSDSLATLLGAAIMLLLLAVISYLIG